MTDDVTHGVPALPPGRYRVHGVLGQGGLGADVRASDIAPYPTPTATPQPA